MKEKANPKDAFGDECKFYEKTFAFEKYSGDRPIIARIDGRCFSKFTKGMLRPFDSRMSLCMQNTTKALMEETGALIAITQSDEISLVFLKSKKDSQIWFNGKAQKMVSQLAAQATLIFFKEVLSRMPEFAYRNPTFDARVWEVPSKEKAAKAILWRVLDAEKNSTSMAASEFFSHKELQGKNGKDRTQMLLEKNVDWNNYPSYFKHGMIYRKVEKLKSFSLEELSNLPEKHKAHDNPDLKFKRSVIEPDFRNFKNISNKVEYIFGEK